MVYLTCAVIVGLGGRGVIKTWTEVTARVRDANLWRPKIGGLSFFHYPPWNFNEPPPSRKIDRAPNGNDLGHYMTSYMMYLLSKFEC